MVADTRGSARTPSRACLRSAQRRFRVRRRRPLSRGRVRDFGAALPVLLALIASACAPAAGGSSRTPQASPLVIERQGSFFAGGTVITAPGTYDASVCPSAACPTPDGQTLHVDHTYVQYQIPPNPRRLPLVMWHGCLSTAWESTPDDREGYKSIFVRRGFAVYIIDQPRQGRAGKSSQGIPITPTPGEQQNFNTWRLGIWPNFFPGVQFPQDPASLDHFFRQGGAAHGPADPVVSSDAVAALFARIGPGILVTHSASGPLGWLTRVKSQNIRAIVAYEPGMPTFGGYLFPEGEVPPAVPLSDGALVSPGSPVARSDFLQLTQIPIQIILGDNIPTAPDPMPWRDAWRVRLMFARQFADVVNRHGGDATVLHLPDAKVYGNTHFPFSDLNNVQVADLLSKYLQEKRLDARQ